MSKHKKGKRKKVEPAVSGPFAGIYWHLRRLARRRRLFVLFDGDQAAPRLTFFDTVRGVALLDYWPASKVWAYAGRPGRGGHCQEHADVIAVAGQVAGAGREATGLRSNSSQFGRAGGGQRKSLFHKAGQL
jgi:hypothetical protein